MLIMCVNIKIIFCVKYKQLTWLWQTSGPAGWAKFFFRGGHGLSLEAALIFIDCNRSGVDLLTIIGALSFCNDAGLKCRDCVSVACHVDGFNS